MCLWIQVLQWEEDESGVSACVVWTRSRASPIESSPLACQWLLLVPMRTPSQSRRTGNNRQKSADSDLPNLCHMWLDVFHTEILITVDYHHLHLQNCCKSYVQPWTGFRPVVWKWSSAKMVPRGWGFNVQLSDARQTVEAVTVHVPRLFWVWRRSSYWATSISSWQRWDLLPFNSHWEALNRAESTESMWKYVNQYSVETFRNLTAWTLRLSLGPHRQVWRSGTQPFWFALRRCPNPCPPAWRWPEGFQMCAICLRYCSYHLLQRVENGSGV